MNYFKRCLPEEQGISSMDIIRFLEAAKQNLCHIHTFVLLRRGKVIAEGYQYPYTSEDKRLLNSVSKTFTAIGVGIALSEKLLTLEDKVISYFPDCLPDRINQKLEKLNIHHLLTMSTGHAVDSIFEMCQAKDWISAFLNMEIKYEPGQRFQYDSGASFMLSAILSKLTGIPLDEYLRTRLFEPLQIDDYIWDRHEGITTGGWGLMLKPEDLAKLGILFLQKGIFDGKRIISKEWIEMATCKQISTCENEYRADWAQGYGFQMWRNAGDGYRADGAFGQFCLIYPKEEIILSLTSEDGFSQELLTTFYNNVVKKVQNIPVGVDASVREKLSNMLCNIERPFTYDATNSYVENKINGKEYLFMNETKVLNRNVKFDFTGSKLVVSIAGSQKIISSKVNCNIGGMHCIIEPVTVILMHEQRTRNWKYAAHHVWVNDSVLMIELCYIETGHTQQIMVEFSGNKLRMLIINGCKRLLEINGMQSNQGMEFSDKILEAEMQ